jgi:hypothetical protein
VSASASAKHKEKWMQGWKRTFDFVFADVDEGGRGNGVGRKVVDHCAGIGVESARLRARRVGAVAV